MDAQIVNVAIPTLSRQFHAPASAVQWTVIAYVLALAVWTPASGWIGDRFGTKRTFLFALALFTLSSALCGLARTLPELIASRALQGTGGGMIVPVASAMLWRAYPPAERARLVRMIMLPVLVAPAAAPVLGGLLIETLSWRWAFYINVPVGVAGVIVGGLTLVEHRERADSRFDLPGFLLSGCGLASLLYAVSEGAIVGWGSPAIVVTGIVGIGMLSVFIRIELSHPDPILRLRLLSNRLFLAGNVVVGLTATSGLGLLYLMPIFLQESLHKSALASGATTVAEAIGVIVSMQTVARFYPRIGPRRMATVALIVLTADDVSLIFIDASTNMWIIRGLLFIAGAAASSALTPMQTSMFATIRPADTGHGSAISNAQRQATLAFGIAIITTVVSSRNVAHVSSFRGGYLVIAGLAAVGAVGAWCLIRDADAAATMVRRSRPRE
jgi:EmrB/QacA subfamily drug resistance transporter